MLLGQIHRATKDHFVALVEDNHFISANLLPFNLLQAAQEVGKALQLGKERLNPGPSSLFDFKDCLPDLKPACRLVIMED